MAAPARIAAFDALLAVESGAVDLPVAIERSRRTVRDDRDRALAAEITTGTLRWRGTLDFLIDATARHPERLSRDVRTILRLSAYQLCHLDRVPASAVVNDAVAIARGLGHHAATGLVNAVLRRLADPAHRPTLPGRDTPLEYLSTTCSLPGWLAKRWLARMGLDVAETWARFCNAAAPVTVRANRLRAGPEDLAARLSAEGVTTGAARWAPDGLVVTAGPVMRTSAVAEGWCLVQDEASQVVAVAAGVVPGERVLDTCASPGGKAAAFAAALGGSGTLVAVDLRPKRIALLRQTLARAGAQRVALVRADAQRALPFGPAFDAVVVDAPCSGLGTIRRDPDVKWRRAEADLARFAARQRDLIRQAAGAVAPGGRLLYATCSSEPDENETVVDAFAAESAGMAPARLDDLPAWPETLAPLLDARGRLKTEPHRHGLEAFFAALFVRPG